MLKHDASSKHDVSDTTFETCVVGEEIVERHGELEDVLTLALLIVGTQGEVESPTVFEYVFFKFMPVASDTGHSIIEHAGFEA